MTSKTYRLFASDGTFYSSPTPGQLGGNRKAKNYGLLTCPAANSALAKG